MSRFAIVKNGLVRNVIEAGAGVAQAIAAETNSSAVPADTANIGDAWDGAAFSPGASATAAPDQVTRYQFVEACDDVLGVTQDAIDAAIAAIADARARRRMRAWWTGAFILQRKGQRMNDLQALMGWSNAQVRQLFGAAASVGE